MSTDGLVPVIGLLGGVGAGKSSVARYAARQRPLLVIDADVVGHDLLQEPDVRAAIQSRFGDTVFDEHGDVDRRALGRIVFAPGADDELAALEAILHPRIHREIESRIAAARKEGGIEAILLDAALLLDAGWNDACNALVFVDTPEEKRRRHVVENRGWTEAELRRREAAQFPLDRKRAAADHVLPNDGTLEDAGERFTKLIDEITGRTAAHSRGT